MEYKEDISVSVSDIKKYIFLIIVLVVIAGVAVFWFKKNSNQTVQADGILPTANGTLTKLQNRLGAVASIDLYTNNDWWFGKDKKNVPLFGQSFDLNEEDTKKIINLEANTVATESDFEAVKSSINQFFIDNGFGITDQNTIELATSTAVNTSYGNGNLKCIATLYVGQIPTAHFFCGETNQEQVKLRKEFLSVINPSIKVNFYVDTVVDKYAVGKSNSGKWWAVKINGQWKKVYTGVDAMSCKLAAKYDIPKDIYVACEDY